MTDRQSTPFQWGGPVIIVLTLTIGSCLYEKHVSTNEVKKVCIQAGLEWRDGNCVRPTSP